MSELDELFTRLTERSAEGAAGALAEVERRAGSMAVRRRRRRRRSVAGALIVVLVVLLGAVAVIRPPDHDSLRVGGVDDTTPPATAPAPGSAAALAAIVPAPGRAKPVRAVGTVVSEPGKPLRLCFQAYLDRASPVCDGLMLDGDLSGLAPFDDVRPNGVRSTGTVTVTGLYDGSSLFSTQPIHPGMDPAADDDYPVYSACPRPEGGWRLPTHGTPADAARAARTLPGYDSSRESAPLAVKESLPGLRSDSDPATRMVLLAFTGPVDGYDAIVREAYDGPTCVVSVRQTDKDSPAVEDRRAPALLDGSSAIGMILGMSRHGGAHYRLMMRYADQAIADWLRAAYPDRPYEFELVPYLHPLS